MIFIYLKNDRKQVNKTLFTLANPKSAYPINAESRASRQCSRGGLRTFSLFVFSSFVYCLKEQLL
jgi:hypothetical protein